ncbi:MAG: glycosyltransferase family 4 protein [Alphaproteobacteria bacterium]
MNNRQTHLLPSLVVNGRFLTQAVSGVQRTAIELLQAFDALLSLPEYQAHFADVIVLLPPTAIKLPLALDNIKPLVYGHLKGHLWEQLELPMAAKGKILLNLCNTGPLLAGQQCTMIHDAAVFDNPNNYSKAFRLYYQLLLPLLGWRSKHLFTVSEFSKNRLLRHHIGKAGKISVAYNGSNHVEYWGQDDASLEQYDLARGGYFLAVGGMSPNKNVQSVIEAFNHSALLADFRLVVVGAMPAHIFNQLPTATSERVIQLGKVSDASLASLYRRATALVFPSFYEGFGLPPIEAMGLGCPAIVAKRAAMPEICGDAALYCEPDNIASIQQQMEKIARDTSLREQLITQGRQQSSGFQWSKTAKNIFQKITALT